MNFKLPWKTPPAVPQTPPSTIRVGFAVRSGLDFAGAVRMESLPLGERTPDQIALHLHLNHPDAVYFDVPGPASSVGSASVGARHFLGGAEPRTPAQIHEDYYLTNMDAFLAAERTFGFDSRGVVVHVIPRTMPDGGVLIMGYAKDVDHIHDFVDEKPKSS